jgi:hypothetical protein
MSYQNEQKRKFDDLRVAIETQNRSQLRARANGGNTILFTYTPSEENLYVAQALHLFPNASFIDLSKLLIEYIDETGWTDFQEFYQAYESSPYLVFKSDGEQSDFFQCIMQAIQKAFDEDKVPFIIRTGILYGTGIENVNIMEHKVVMEHHQPLVIFYPSKVVGDNLYFLNFKPASKYRCNLID